ncbi:MAG: glycosyltransferase family 4 protein [Minisyncoccia bacterium]
MAQIKVAFVLFTNIAVGAGTETSVQTYALQLRKLDPEIEITIVQTDWMASSSNAPLLKSSIEGINLLTLHSPHSFKFYKWIDNNLSPFMQLFMSFSLYPFIYILINHNQIKKISKESDVIYFVNLSDSFLWLILNEPVRKKNIESGHCGLIPFPRYKYIKGLLNKFVYKIFNRFTFSYHYLTNSQALDVKRHNKYDFILPNGVDTDRFKPLKKDLSSQNTTNNIQENDTKHPTKFIYFGRLDRSKGVAELIDAFNRYPYDDTLTVIGTGEFVNLVKNSPKKINYEGFIEHEILPERISDHDIFIFPTHGETFGIVVLEAVASGLFCLVSEKQKGIFDDLEAIGAIKYIPDTSEGILNAMIKYRNFKPTYEKKLQWHKYMEENYDWKKISKELYKMIVMISNAKNKNED